MFLHVVDLAVCAYASHASERTGPFAAVELRECTFA